MACDRQIALLTIYAEASSALQFERECIANVIKNRTKDPRDRWSKTTAGVCLDYMQFSSWNGDLKSRRNLLRAMNAPDTEFAMMQAGTAWDRVNSGSAGDPTLGATHYTDKTITPPGWTDGATMTLETEKFRFYSGVR